MTKGKPAEARQLDETDRALIGALATDGRQTVRALARTVNLSEPAVRDRVLRLEHAGVITGYHARATTPAWIPRQSRRALRRSSPFASTRIGATTRSCMPHCAPNRASSRLTRSRARTATG